MTAIDPNRKIIHIDMDAFYASVEQLDNPDLKGKPIAVGGGEKRGVVAAASYEARKFGVKSAMSSALAKRKCPQLIFVKPRFERYKEISNMIRKVFHEYTDLVEPLSLDEAFLDVSANLKGHPSATAIAAEIRQKIFEVTGLTASAGISINKFTAKIASDINKPNGQKTIKPKEVVAFLELLSIRKFFGIGKVTADKMNSWGIYNGAQLKQHSREFLVQNFGKSGNHFYDIVRGIQYSEVRPDRIRKSVGTEHTFENNIYTETDALIELEKIANESVKRLKKAKTKGKTVTIKLKYNDFTQITRSKTISDFTDQANHLMKVIREIMKEDLMQKPVRLLGVSMSNLKVDKEEELAKNKPQLTFKF
ncbi:DNA polymerase IV [Crocinitomix catalasitica]|uniref:DNA polymerase IV n=1 Tax=Crocinitomix catalasitica TaxID=184607 RepID=UPI0004803D3D|nr:DNA polymerase IV [Crocinitomix catalasitica]